MMLSAASIVILIALAMIVKLKGAVVTTVSVNGSNSSGRQPGHNEPAVRPFQECMTRMKVHRSPEMLAYIAIAGISLLLLISAVSAYYPRMNQSLGDYDYSNFVESINTAILNNDSSVALYVPEGLCVSQLNGSTLDTKYGIFYFVEEVRMHGNLTCSAAKWRRLVWLMDRDTLR